MFNVSALNLSASNISVNSITANNVSMFNVSALNLSASNISVDSITASNVSMFNVSALNLSALNISVDSITVSNMSAFNVSILNLSASNISVDSITANNVSMFNVSALNASITNLSASAANIYNVITPNIDASAAQLTIGGTTASSLVLGKAANTTNILGNIQINSDSGTLGQVLTSNGNNTVPTWTTVSGVGGGGWVGTALSNLSMGIYSIIGSILDSSGTNLSIGDTTSASVTIGRASNVTNILGNLQIAGSAGAAGKVLTSNATTAVWSDTSWVGTATSNLSMGANSIICSNIDASATALTIGGVTAQGLTIGKALTDTNILGNLKIAGDAGLINQVLRSNGTTASWGDYGTATANLAMGTYSITGTSLDSATTLAIGTVNQTGLTIGRTGIQTSIIGTNVQITGTLQALTSTINTIQTNGVGATINQYITNTGGPYNLLTTNATGIANILTGTTRSATTNILTSTNNNILNLGGRSTTNGMTLNIAGVATNFQATVNTFTNGITAPSIDSASGTLSIGTTNATGINLNSKAVSNITIGINQFITLSASSTLPAIGQVGYRYKENTINAVTIYALGTSFANIGSFFTIGSGTWIVELAGNFSNNAGFAQIGLSEVSATVDITRTASTSALNSGSQAAYVKMTTVIQQAGSVIWYIVGYRGSTAMNVAGLTVNITRIA